MTDTQNSRKLSTYNDQGYAVKNIEELATSENIRISSHTSVSDGETDAEEEHKHKV